MVHVIQVSKKKTRKYQNNAFNILFLFLKKTCFKLAH